MAIPAAAALAPAFVGALYNLAGTLAGQVLIGLGISVVTYTGMDISLGFLKTQALSAFSGLTSEMIGLISYMGVGQAINIVFSAIVVKQSLNGITGGTLKRWVKK